MRTIRLPEYQIRNVSNAIFALEDQLPEGNAIRLQLYRTRIALSEAMALNRANKDRLQEGYEFEPETAATGGETDGK